MSKIKLTTQVPISKSPIEINHSFKMALWGSCFAENMKEHFMKSGFQTDSNPFGVIYNPASILEIFKLINKSSKLGDEHLTCKDGQYTSWLFHSSLQAENKKNLLIKVEQKLNELRNNYRKNKQTFIFSIGTAWVYQLIDKQLLVANCHKSPASLFNKELLSILQITDALQQLISIIKSFNKQHNIIFTLSPVRHLKDGFIENNRSKSRLIEAILQVCQDKLGTYFPAYEIMQDELRDYRYYKDDLIHPTSLAVQFIWDKFKEQFFNDETTKISNTVASYHKLNSHRVLNPMEETIKKHQNQIVKLKEEIEKKHPEVYFPNQ